MNKLNIRTKKVNPTLSFQLKGADDEMLVNEDGSPCTVTIYGPGSKEYVAANQAKSAKLIEKAMKGKEVKLTPKEAAVQQVEFLTAITKEMDLDYVDDNGTALEGEAKLRAIYGDTEIGFIAEQVAAKVGDWGNFTSASKKS